MMATRASERSDAAKGGRGWRRPAFARDGQCASRSSNECSETGRRRAARGHKSCASRVELLVVDLIIGTPLRVSVRASRRPRGRRWSPGRAAWARTLEGLALRAARATLARRDARARARSRLVNRSRTCYTTSSCSADGTEPPRGPHPGEQGGGHEGRRVGQRQPRRPRTPTPRAPCGVSSCVGGDGRGSSTPSDPTDAAAARSAEADPECTLVLRRALHPLRGGARGGGRAVSSPPRARRRVPRPGSHRQRQARACSVRCHSHSSHGNPRRRPRRAMPSPTSPPRAAATRVAKEKWDANARRAERVEELVRGELLGDPAGVAPPAGLGAGPDRDREQDRDRERPFRAPRGGRGESSLSSEAIASLRSAPVAASLPRVSEAEALGGGRSRGWLAVADASAAKRCKDRTRAVDADKDAARGADGGGAAEEKARARRGGARTTRPRPSSARGASPVAAEGARAPARRRRRAVGVSLPSRVRARG